jgi:hypothetical protein
MARPIKLQTEEQAKSFLLKNRSVDHKTGCWLWTAGKAHYGYGRFRWRGPQRRAHRVAYELFVGEIPDGLFVCHHCDNPPCFNPKHLYLGTQAENMRDAKKRGRMRGRRSNQPTIAEQRKQWRNRLSSSLAAQGEPPCKNA